ncbi:MULTISPECIES: DUF192 domain-containing protein [unclassified Adlercreutzia]|uniref:DUF192 domain-containing protein n=1 Tax=unclassified Adlercreutzia TaxID=2636013 RepID=UPI0013ED72C6|nr:MULTISPECIES: DUF192 domain-containing protein [unclassified Adlercreutzia]
MTGVELLTTWRARVRGLLFRAPDQVVYVLVPCCDVHTFGMRHALDLAFVSREGVVVEVRRNVGPRRWCACRGAVAVAERFARAGPWLEAGDVLEIAARRARGEAADDGGKKQLAEREVEP